MKTVLFKSREERKIRTNFPGSNLGKNMERKKQFDN